MPNPQRYNNIIISRIHVIHCSYKHHQSVVLSCAYGHYYSQSSGVAKGVHVGSSAPIPYTCAPTPSVACIVIYCKVLTQVLYALFTLPQPVTGTLVCQYKYIDCLHGIVPDYTTNMSEIQTSVSLMHPPG